MKKCGLVSCGIELPPNRDRVILEIRRLPKITSPKFWYRIFMFTIDIAQEEFCSDEHLLLYLQNLGQMGLPVKKK